MWAAGSLAEPRPRWQRCPGRACFFRRFPLHQTLSLFCTPHDSFVTQPRTPSLCILSSTHPRTQSLGTAPHLPHSPTLPPPTNPFLFWSRFQPPLLLFLSPTLPPWSSRVSMRHYLSNSAAAAAGPLRPRSLVLCCVSSAALEVGSNIFTRQFSSIDGRGGLQKNLQQNLQQKKSLRS